MRERNDLFESIRGGELARVRARLDEEPPLLFARSQDGVPVLLWALYCAQPAIVDELLARGAEIDFPTAVALDERAAVAEGLRLDPALANARSPDGFPALCLAAYFGRCELLAMLLAAGAEVEAVAEQPLRVRPLHSAVAHRDPATALALAGALLAAGADPRATQAGGYTPLMTAASRGNLALVELLLARGADPGAESDGGQTAADLARARGHHEVAARLGSGSVGKPAPAPGARRGALR